MPNIEENAFQIARYLLENPQKDNQVVIRDALELSDANFRVGLQFLVDDDCCKTAGQLGSRNGIIWQRNLVRLQNFVNRINQQRVVLPYNAERLLKTVARSLLPTSDSETIITNLGWDNPQYLDAYEILKYKDLIDAQYADDKPVEIWITKKGKEIVRDDFHLVIPASSAFNTVYNTTNIIGNNIVNIGSTLTSVSQSVQANSYITDQNKKELEFLLNQLSDALSSVSVENGEEAEAVAEMAKNLIENATKEKPNKPLVKISAEGLKKAAENIAAIAPKVLLTAQAIIVFIKALYPSLLP